VTALKSILLLGVAYISTSFQVNNNVSIVLDKPAAATEEVEIVSPKFYHKDTLSLVAGKNYHIDFFQNYTAIKVTEVVNNQAAIHFISANDSLYFGTLISYDDIDIPPGFAVFSKPTNQIVLTSNRTTDLIIELFYAPPIALNYTAFKQKKTDCERPISIPQSQWRNGLPNPMPGRVAVVVKHCIVHHSAGSNTDTNYINTIRNIYLYHTQSNGWDDIGYNFVIAPNGVVFDGRDPLGVAEQDNIQGAHFCAKNGETMGVCLLGNYDLVSPKTEMLEALEQLLVWKLHKENLSALANFPHPDANSPPLGTIAMHQNGCATACPGDSVRYIFDDIKEEIEGKLKLCKGVTSVESTPIKFKQMVYPNPSNGKFYALIEKEANIKRFKIISLEGKTLADEPYLNTGYINTDLPSGTYLLELWTSERKVSNHRIIIQKR
jgi:hypothetical protein